MRKKNAAKHGFQGPLRAILDDVAHVIHAFQFSESYLTRASGLSHATLYRIKFGVGMDHRFSTVYAIAKAVGLEIKVVEAAKKSQQRSA
jgi:hypothetical protein